MSLLLASCDHAAANHQDCTSSPVALLMPGFLVHSFALLFKQAIAKVIKLCAVIMSIKILRKTTAATTATKAVWAGCCGPHLLFHHSGDWSWRVGAGIPGQRGLCTKTLSQNFKVCKKYFSFCFWTTNNFSESIDKICKRFGPWVDETRLDWATVKENNVPASLKTWAHWKKMSQDTSVCFIIKLPHLPSPAPTLIALCTGNLCSHKQEQDNGVEKGKQRPFPLPKTWPSLGSCCF